MKNFKLIIGTVLFLALATFQVKAQKGNDIIATINQKNTDTVEVFIQKFEGDVVKINIYGKTGVLIHRDVIRKSNNVKMTYDISSFPEGNYKFEIEKNKESYLSQVIDTDLPENLNIATTK